ncbi:hypothetical protein QP405_03030 [Gleimia europaea]|uniref:hypothetical protein n=1 Tax=Gleimia europaea TaxID=66228 RepID=UPI002658B27F|nr:hypothetical protein [Gleimia europaea]MDK7142836.1 hypothetical protein [Gleimia europaea]
MHNTAVVRAPVVKAPVVCSIAGSQAITGARNRAHDILEEVSALEPERKSMSRRDAAQKWLDKKIEYGIYPPESVLLEQTYSDGEYELFDLDTGSDVPVMGGLMCILVDSQGEVHPVSSSPSDELFDVVMDMLPDE